MLARSKKDIDRELMYKKILPTAMSPENTVNKATPDDGMAETLSQNIAAATLEVSIQKPVEVVVSSPTGEERPPKLPEEKSEVALPGQPQAKAQVRPYRAEDMQSGLQTATALTEPPLVNLMEAFVEKRLDAALKKFKCCDCERCRKDVLAVALNKLPPLYVIEDDPDIRDLHERERAAQVATALVQAILTVKARPSHEVNR